MTVWRGGRGGDEGGGGIIGGRSVVAGGREGRSQIPPPKKRLLVSGPLSAKLKGGGGENQASYGRDCNRIIITAFFFKRRLFEGNMVPNSNVLIVVRCVNAVLSVWQPAPRTRCTQVRILATQKGQYTQKKTLTYATVCVANVRILPEPAAGAV